MSDKVWFVTGASSGFGRAMTEHALEIGNKVVATLRRPDAIADLSTRYPPAQLLIVQVDVTEPAQVTAAFTRAQETFGRIDVVFNNAGIGLTGEIESIDETDARRLFEVNFWGAARVSREAVRFFREVNKPMGGRLLQVSSVLGIVGRPVVGYYCATKSALEAVTESLAVELDPAWNIQLTIIEPGPFRTDICQAQKNYISVPPHPAYANPNPCLLRAHQFYAASELFDGDVVKAVKLIEKVSRLEDAPLRFPLHKRVISVLKEKANSLSETADKFESWNEDVYRD